METFNKILQHLYIYTEFYFLCQALLMLGSLNSLTHTRDWLKPLLLQQFLLMFQVSF